MRTGNLSYWYNQRSLLGGRFHSLRSTAPEPLGTQWKATIVELKRNEEFEMVPGPSYLGLFATQAKAYKACENAGARRDQNPGEAEGSDKTGIRENPEMLLCTHLNVTIVSEVFVGLSHWERVRIVYEALAADSSSSPPSSSSSSSSPEEPLLLMKNFCTRGPAVRSLPHLRHLAALPFELLLDLRTPSQFDPKHPQHHDPTEEEMYGRSRAGLATRGVDPAIGKRQRPSELKNFVRIPEPTANAGGLYGHFYHDMTKEVRDMVNEEYAKNMKLARGDRAVIESGAYKKSVVGFGQTEPGDSRAMIIPDEEEEGKEGKGVNVANVADRDKMAQAAAIMKAASEALANGSDPSQAAEKAAADWELAQAGLALKSPKQAAEDFIRRKTAILGQKQPGQGPDAADGEANVIAKYQVLTKKAAAVAKRLQRMYRRRLLPRVARETNRRHYAALLLQKAVRAYYGKEYVDILREVMAVASVKIQAAYRGILGRRKAAAFRAFLTKVALTIQPIVRGWIGRTFAAWRKENWKRAVVMQRIVRGFNGRRKFERRGVAVAKSNFDMFALRIQCVARGFFERTAFRKLMERLVFNKIMRPFAVMTQRAWRGVLGRRTAFQLRLRRDAAAEIQRHARGLLKRRWLAYVKWKKYERHCAVMLQARFKGWLDREIMRRRRLKAHFANVVVPSALKIQSQYRGYVQRQNLALLKLKWFNAMRVQGAWRAFVATRLAREMFRRLNAKIKGQSCTKVQRLFRGWWWRRAAYQKKMAEAARRLYASRVIMRGYIRYRDGKRYRQVKEAWEVEQSAETLMDLDEERQEVLEDLEDIEVDIFDRDKSLRRVNKRVKAIVHFNEQVSLRLPRVEWEIDNPGDKDITQGWYEAFQDEFEKLHNMTALAREELLQCRVNARKLQTELDTLWLEREDVQVDLDHVGTAEQVEFELLRRLELRRADRRRTEEWEKMVRMEKNKWKVDDVRRTVIRKKRHDLDKIAEDLKDNRTDKHMSTLSYWKRHDFGKVEKDAGKRKMREERAKRAEEVSKTGLGNASIRMHFDAVVGGTLDIIKNGTLNMRNDRHDLREDPRAMCRTCGKVFCVCDQDENPTNTYFHAV